jgi:hypothetical protein
MAQFLPSTTKLIVIAAHVGVVKKSLHIYMSWKMLAISARYIGGKSEALAVLSGQFELAPP